MVNAIHVAREMVEGGIVEEIGPAVGAAEHVRPTVGPTRAA